MPPPQNPTGEFVPSAAFDEARAGTAIEVIRNAARDLRETVDGLNDEQLDTKYRNWTIRQITHHLAESHLHSYIRFKWTLTEDHPTIKAYEEADWAELSDSKTGAIEPALALITGLHLKWVQLLESMTSTSFERTFLHPQTDETVSLWQALDYYAWHSQHHIAQIAWVKDQHGWNSSDE